MKHLSVSYICVVSYNDATGDGVKNVMYNPHSNQYPPTSNDLIDLNTHIYMELNVPFGKFVLLNIIPVVDEVELPQ